VVALGVSTFVLFRQLDQTRRELAQIREALRGEINKLREASSVATQAHRQHLDSLRQELEAARRSAAAAAGQARVEALRRAEELAKKLEEEQARQQQAVATELSQVRQAATEASARIADVRSDVSSVRSEVAATRSELEKTIAELRSVRGDLGVQSGLIATNAKELAALKALGERNYYEFTLNKTRDFQKVGEIAIKLNKTDPRRHRFSIELIADDKRVEKKDRYVNEPLQFYVAGSRIPYEIVVNEVRKDQIIGYLSTPKVRAERK
jgi:chromosome segregation ATPase